MKDWAEIISALTPLLFAAFAFGMLKFVPSRNEFQMHKDQDDERHSDIKEALARIERTIEVTKTDIIREVKNGHANRSEHA